MSSESKLEGPQSLILFKSFRIKKVLGWIRYNDEELEEKIISYAISEWKSENNFKMHLTMRNPSAIA